jgi:hypothetical protein
VASFAKIREIVFIAKKKGGEIPYKSPQGAKKTYISDK